MGKSSNFVMKQKKLPDLPIAIRLPKDEFAFDFIKLQ